MPILGSPDTITIATSHMNVDQAAAKVGVVSLIQVETSLGSPYLLKESLGEGGSEKTKSQDSTGRCFFVT